MKKILLSTLMLFIFCFALTGCQLAREEFAAENQESLLENTDQLVGVYVTTEYMPAHISDTSDGRIYGEFNEEKQGFVFEGVDVIGYSLVYIEDYDCGTSGIADYTTSSPAFGSVSSSVSNDPASCDVKSSLYYNNNDLSGELIFFLNPVYQTSSGRFYLENGPSINVGPSESSLSITNQNTVTENEKTEEKTTRFTVSFIEKPLIKEVTFTQFNADNQSIDTQTFHVNSIPDTLFWKENAAYMIVTAADELDELSRSLIERTEGTNSDTCVLCTKREGAILISEEISILQQDAVTENDSNQ